MANKDLWDPGVLLEKMDVLENRVPRVSRDYPDYKEDKEMQEGRVHQERMAIKDPQVWWVHQVTVVMMEKWVPLDPQDLQEKMADQDPKDQEVNKDFLD